MCRLGYGNFLEELFSWFDRVKEALNLCELFSLICKNIELIDENIILKFR